MPRVSVILTSFNHAAYLNESIDSVLGQTFTDIELIVLDDASSDNSWALISRYTDRRMRTYLSPAPGEVMHHMNYALSIAVGEYIAIQHSDDAWTPEKLERQVAYLDAHPEAGAVFTWVQFIDEVGEKFENDWFNKPNQSRWMWLNELFNQKNTLCNPSALIRKRCYEDVGGYRYGLAQTDDAEFWSRLLIHHPIHVLEEKLTLHRRFLDRSNVSGDRPEVAVRSEHEWNFVRENLLALASFEEVIQIFPDLECWRRSNDCNIKFLLAMACIQSPHRSAWPLGLRWLFELLNETTQRNQLAELYCFTDLSFIELSATLDSYLVDTGKQQHRTVAEYEAKLQGVLSEYAVLQGMLAERETTLQSIISEQSRHIEHVQNEYIQATQDAKAKQLEEYGALMANIEELRLVQIEKDREVVELRSISETARAQANAEQRKAEHAKLKAFQLRKQVQNIDRQREIISARLATLELSSSWRATAPIRHLLVNRPRTARTIRRVAKLIWWTATFQLLRKSREWRAGRRTMNHCGTESMVTPSPLGTVLGDWLTEQHKSPIENQSFFSWQDDLIAYYHDLNIDSNSALLLAKILLEGFNPAWQEQLNLIVSQAVEHNDHFFGLVQALENSPLFEAEDYMSRISLQADDRQAAIHYLLVGEPLGFAPSSGFNPVYYMGRYDDLRISPRNALIHYIRHGEHEGRQPVNFCSPPMLRPWAEKPERENIILAVHETSRTGAPILGWNIAKQLAAIYNVFTVRLGDGPLSSEFEALSVEVHGPFSRRHAGEIDVTYGVRPLFEGRQFKYAIVNSIECRTLLNAFTRAGIPTVLLVHEFSSCIWPHKALVNAYQTASEIVFPAPIVARSALDNDSALQARSYHIVPQGMSVLPSLTEAKDTAENPKIKTLAALRAGGTMIVLGAGSVNIRKGVDIFMEIASATQRRASGRPVHFIWVGDGYRPREDLGYSLYLEEHLNRAGLVDHFTFLEAVTNLEPVYELADIFLLTSRLDPLPNVTIDAAMRGIPIVCFQNASGTADLFLTKPETRHGVVPYLDSGAAADIIVQLANDEAKRKCLAEATQRYAAELFDMDRYVAELDRLGSKATVRKIVEAVPLSVSTWWFDATWYAAQYGTARDHTGYLNEGLAEGHAPGPVAAHILACFAPGMQFSAALYKQFQHAITWRRSIPKASLRLLTALYVPAWHAQPGLDGFLAYLREGLASGVAPGPLFDANVYQARASAAGLPPFEFGESAIIHWLRHGVAARIVPTSSFDEEFYCARYPDLRELSIWGFAHYLEDGAREGRVPNGRARWYRAPVSLPAVEGMLPAYESWYDEEQLGTLLASPWLAKIYADIQHLEPEIGDIKDISDYLLPPHQDALTALHSALRARLPSTRYHSVICVPWIRIGGADLVAGLLAAALLRIRPTERVLILRTDSPHFERADWLPEAADCVDMSDLRTALPEPEAQKLLRVLCRGVGARRVFNVNSRLCWTALRDNQANMAASHANYAYLFCWDQTSDGRRVGYPAEFFAETVASASVFLTDTEYLKAELTAQYRLAPQMQEKIVALATPAQTFLRPTAVAREVAETHRRLTPCVLWAGRLDRQKRFDLVCDIARIMPDVTFRCWGTAVLDAQPDLTGRPANIVMEGTFESFDELPLTQAGAWLFTSSWEGLPTTIIELAMRGVAVVASAVGGVPELITYDTGWPLPPEAEANDYAAALRAVLADPSGAAERAEALQSRVAKRHTTATYDAALARILDQEDVS